MYQVLVQYFEDRYASFFCQSTITEYGLLLQRIKDCIPSFKQLQDDQIRVAYKDVQSECYINIDSRDEHLHLYETFRNSVTCGSYERIHLKVWENDSPFLLRKRSNVQRNDANEANNDQVDEAMPNKNRTSSRSLHFPQTSGTDLHQVTNWKENKKEELSTKLQLLHDKKLATETHIRELEIEVPEPPAAGTYRIICGNCHIRGHRAEGNRRNDACNLAPCSSYYTCGQKKKHPEHFEEIRNAKKNIKDINKEIDSAEMEKKNIESFQSKSISAFSSALTPRLLKAFGDKYSLKTSSGKLVLQKDITTLRAACENKIPEETGNDRELFTRLLNKQTAKMNDFKSSFSGKSFTATSAPSVNKTEITLNVSPIRSHEKQKSKRECYLSDESDSSSSTSTDSSAERRSKQKKGKHRRSTKTSNRKKSSRRKHKRKRYSSYETDSDDNRKSSSKNVHENKSNNSNLQNTGKSVGEANMCSLDELATIAVAINSEKTATDRQ